MSDYLVELVEGKTTYLLVRNHFIDFDSGIVESILLGTYDTHAEAYAALVADHGKVAPDEDMFWTRPNWTTVCDENNITWSILPVSVTPEGERVLVEEEYGPLEYEMDA